MKNNVKVLFNENLKNNNSHIHLLESTVELLQSRNMPQTSTWQRSHESLGKDIQLLSSIYTYKDQYYAGRGIPLALFGSES